jgi:hypothetical protein
MPFSTEDIASALELSRKSDQAIIAAIKARLEEKVEGLKLPPGDKGNLEMMVQGELGSWLTNAEIQGRQLPNNQAEWLQAADECVASAQIRLAKELNASAKQRAGDEAVKSAQKEEQRQYSEHMEREAGGLGLPRIEEYVDELTPDIVGDVGMDKVLAARLEEHQGLVTSSLSSCTGVTLFDPETRVGALMHVYEGKVSIPDALKAMRDVDPSIEPSRLQATLMPGNSGGVNASHLGSVHDQLSKAGITKVRDFSKEGHAASTVFLKGDGSIMADIRGAKQGVHTGVSEQETTSKKPSVGEVLGMGKYARSDNSEKLGSGLSTGDTNQKAAVQRRHSF